MINSLKKAMFLCLLLIAFSLIGCKSTITENQLPNVKPKDFNFVFNYGVNAKNQIDTIKGQYTKDMVVDPPATTALILSDKEMDAIYLSMKSIEILNYPESFNPKSNVIRTPFQTYSIKIVIDGKEKNIYWKDENISKTKEATQLRDLFKKIEEIIINKEEYKSLPAANGGYD